MPLIHGARWRGMTPEEIQELERQRRLTSVPRAARPRCGAKTKAGTACMAQALDNGRCAHHGGLSTGPRTPEGKAKRAEIGREHMLKMWAERWSNGERRQNLTDEGRERISEAAKRRHAANRQDASLHEGAQS
jgi:hypothetical protein